MYHVSRIITLVHFHLSVPMARYFHMRSSWQHALLLLLLNSPRLDSTRFAFVLALINTRFRAANARRLDSCLLMPTYPFALLSYTSRLHPPVLYPFPLRMTDTQMQFVCVDCSVSTLWATQVSPHQSLQTYEMLINVKPHISYI